jgi:transcriptional regulator with XRE-family HTH domain
MARLSQLDVAKLLFVTERTVRYWESGKNAIPYAAYKLLRIHVGYELPGKAWQGWSIRGDTLWSPESRGFNAAYLGYLWLTYAMARRWQAMIASQEKTPAASEERTREGAPALRLVNSG